MKVIALLLAALLAACQSAAGPVTFYGTHDPALLRGGEWTLVRIHSASGRVFPAASKLTVRFSPDGQFGGSAGPNGYGGAYEAGADGTLRMEPPGGTLIGGPDAERAGRYLHQMVRSTRFEVTATDLRVYAPDGGILSFERDT